jgi:hypothetical protein
MTTKMLQTILVATMCGALLIAGCKISKQGDGEDKKVSIEAPGASLHVDTGTTANDSGLPLYPGAQEKHNTGEEKSHAHVNLNMPFLNVKVVALKFTSDDAPEKVVDFYRSKLGNYGTVLECKGGGQDVEVGSGRGMDSPVKCDKTHGNSEDIYLKVGTEGNQHVVSVKPNGKGSEFALVYVRLGKNKNNDDYGGKQPS